MPRNAKKNGHKVLAVEHQEGPNYRILIEAFGLK
jgi:TusA-related sulfurtransferase